MRPSSRAAVALVLIFLIAGCTSTTPSGGESTSAIAAAEADPSPSVAPSMAPFVAPGPTMEALKFVTRELDPYGLEPEANRRDSILEWAEDYCDAANLSPCAGIEERAEYLCIERWDCHPAVMVRFDQGIAAFLYGGVFPNPEVIAVWHPESDPAFAPYGGAHKLLEGFLYFVEVCPMAPAGEYKGATCPDY